MPCDSSHLRANSAEIEASRVLCVLDELDGRTVDRSWWEGYHPKAYSNRVTSETLDKLTAAACTRLKATPNVAKYSLELQVWWRDHQVADAKKEEQRIAREKRAEVVKGAVAKLTPEERKALGFDDEDHEP